MIATWAGAGHDCRSVRGYWLAAGESPCAWQLPDPQIYGVGGEVDQPRRRSVLDCSSAQVDMTDLTHRKITAGMCRDQRGF